jgi:Lon protease-like protein
MKKDGLFDLALFPIPGCVCFPQTVVPLHVFEPRYRQMVEDCMQENRLLGVCHTKSIERFATGNNLTTFSPEDIFSAGPVEIQEKLEDGRYLISIHMLKRFRLVDLIQDSPYKIGRCEEYQDKMELSFNEVSEAIQNQKKVIVGFIKNQLAQQGANAEEELRDLEKENSVNQFTFKLFKFYRMQEGEMQLILNSQDPIDRLSRLYDFTNLLLHPPKSI